MVRLYRAGKYTEATEIAKQSLAINEKVQGHQHPEVATSLNKLALLFQELGRYADAERLLTQSLSIFEKLPDHPDLRQSLSNLAGLYVAQGRYAEAETLYKRSLAISEKIGGADHPSLGDAILSLARLYKTQGRTPFFNTISRFSIRPLAPSTPTLASRSATWPRCTMRRLATRTPRPFTHPAARSWRRRWTRINIQQVHRSTNWQSCS
jgi:tetratricopeptide (TPR) repeat protein